MCAIFPDWRMRFFSWKAACAAALCAPLLALAQQQPSDYAREKRWSDEIVPSLVVGEPVWLEAPRTQKFLGIYTEAKNAKGAVILAHGLGVHPDYGIIGELRMRLPDMGYTTLSIQMPILAADAPAARYPVLFWEADARFAAALTFLRRKKYGKVVLLSHSMGSRMANHYIAAHPQVPLAGWISLSISSGEFAPMKRLKFPVYDVYAEKDLDPVLAGVEKRAAAIKRVRGSSQTMVFGTDHFFASKEKELAALIRLLLEGEAK
jgi:pimeloyl-ACP methyl ester carboxylesterase